MTKWRSLLGVLLAVLATQVAVPGLPDAAGAADRAARRRRGDGHHRARRRREAHRQPRPDHRGGQPRRGRRHDRRGAGRGRGARRLHAHHDERDLGDTPAALFGALRDGPRFRPDLAGKRSALPARRPSLATREDRPGTRDLRQSQSRQAQLCLRGPGQHHPSGDRAAARADRDADDPRALQRHGRCLPGPHRGQYPDRVGQHRIRRSRTCARDGCAASPSLARSGRSPRPNFRRSRKLASRDMQ